MKQHLVKGNKKPYWYGEDQLPGFLIGFFWDHHTFVHLIVILSPAAYIN